MKRICTRLCFAQLLVIFIFSVGFFPPNELVSEAAGPQATTIDPRLRDKLLEFVTIPAESLPKSVQLVETVNGGPTGLLRKNPELLVDSPWIQWLAFFFGIEHSSELDSLDAAVIAIYHHKNSNNHIGLHGLYYSDENSAKERFAKLAMRKDRALFVRKGKLLLNFWKDAEATDNALRVIRDYFVKAKLDIEGDATTN